MGRGKLEGSRAIVTGAAQGIGEAIARTLGREGAAVALVDINSRDAARISSEMEGRGGSALAIQADVTLLPEVNRMVETVVETWGGLDILVNNAGGFPRFIPFQEVTEEEWDWIMALNLKSIFFCSQVAARAMMKEKKGRIVNLASQAALGPNPSAPSYLPYGTAKAGVVGFTKHLAKELGPHGITVNAISPGTALTPRVKKVRDEKTLQRIAEMNPLGHLAEPQDIAEAVSFLASKEARYITGVNLLVNSGAQMG